MEKLSREFIVTVFALLILGSLLIFGGGKFSGNRQAAIVSNTNQTVVLQDGLNGYAGTRDTYLYSYHHTSNFGSELELRSSEVEVYTILARFQIFKSEGGPVPNNAVVQSTTLSLYKTSYYDFTYQARRLIKDWSELGATWDSTGQGMGWAGGRVEGSNVMATPDGTASIGWNPGWLNIDVTSGVRAFGAGNPNYGWNIYGAMKGSGSGGSEGNINTKYFYARESSQRELRPKLTVVYTPILTSVVDTTPPAISITAPTSSVTVSGSSVAVSVNASDNVGVTGVQFKLDGANLGAEDTSDPYSIIWNSTTATNGSHTLTAVARDAAGNMGTSGSISVTVSNIGVIAPTVTLSASPATITSGGSATLTWSSTNATSCTASGSWSGTKATSGTQLVSPTVTSIYTLTCTGSGGSTAQSTTVTVTTVLTSTKFNIGDRVQTTATLNVRSTPSTSGTLLGTQPPSALGTVIGGSTYADGYYWWQVNYDNAPDGWSVENYLVKTSSLVSGQWAVVSKNTLNDVLWRSGGQTITQLKGGNTNIENYFTSWNGGAFDPVTKKLWIAAQGGDSDGADNGIYTFDLATGLWSLITPPTPGLIPALSQTGTWSYVDAAGTYGSAGKTYPQSRHTYGASIAIPGVGAWIGGGVAWHPYNITQTDIAKTWHATLSGWKGPFDSIGSYNEGRWSAWDSIKNRVLYQDNDRLRAYDPAKLIGSRVVAIDDGSQSSDSRNRFCSGAFDSKRNRLMGACVLSSGIPTLEGFDLGITPIKRKTFLSSAPWPSWTTAPGFLYDPVGDRYVLWPNGGAKLYIIDPTTFIVTTIVGSGVDPGTPTSPYAGTWGRFAYVPGDDLYLVAHKVTGPVYVFRPDRGGIVLPPAPVISFYASSTSIISGLSTTLLWTATDATSCTASGAWSGAKAISGSQLVSPTITSTYTLTCIGTGGSTTQSTIVTVTATIDIIAPTVSITSPSNGATVSGSSVAVSVNASDNVGVTGVQFKLDGANLGAEDTSDPYSIIWNSTTATNGSHTLTAVARDAAGNMTTATAVNVTVSNTLTTSITPGIFTAIFAPDKGKGIPGSGMKHVSLAINSDNERIYAEGGDYAGNSFDTQSYEQQTFSFSVAERLLHPSDRNAGWFLEYPYCGPTGALQPKHPDFVGWTWDSTRHLFWMVPGVMEITNFANCAGETSSRSSDPAFIAHQVMTFNPATKQWLVVSADSGPDPAEAWQSVYDPAHDTLIRFGFNGGSGAVVNIFDIKTKTWSRVGLSPNALGQDIRLTKEMLAADLVDRVIYGIDGSHGRLHRYNMDTKKIEDLGAVPGGKNSWGSSNDMYSVWDTNNKILYFFRPDTNTFHIYHPDTKTWESPVIVTSPLGLKVTARHGLVFDPTANALVMMGGAEPVNPYIFLYRYK